MVLLRTFFKHFIVVHLFLWSFISSLLRFIFSLDLNIYIHTVWQEIIIDFCQNLTRNWSEYPPSLWDLMTSSDGEGTWLFSCWYRVGSDSNGDHRSCCCCWIVTCCHQHKAVLCSSLGSETCLTKNIFKSGEAFNTFHMQWLRVRIPLVFSVIAKLSTRCLPLRILQENDLNVRCHNYPLK